MPFGPSTDVADIKAALGAVAENDISGVERVYTDEPDGPPEDGSIVIACPQAKIDDASTSGKIRVTWVVPVRYLVRRKGNGEDIQQAESYLLPLFLAYAAWFNQELDEDVYEVNINTGGIGQFIYASQVFRAATVTIELTSEYNIPVVRS